MADESKSPKKGSITEEDAASLIQRYSVEMVLTLLQEVERVAGDKIDWNELVKNTATGISCAREYQMLWRHLAYGNDLEDELDSDAELLDDDSDLEYELEASPDVSPEESDLAAACVKVLIASGSNDSHLPDNSTIDAPLTINIRSSTASTAASDSSILSDAIQGTNVTIPVSVQKSTACLTTSNETTDWSEEEDMKLTAAVQKYGAADWANVAKGDFENGTSASELSKRWTSLTKKLHNPTVGSSSQFSETELPTVPGALPMDNTLNAANQIRAAESTKPQIQPFNAPASQPDKQFSITGPPISQIPEKTPPMKHTTIADSVKSAAIAAGARIGTPTEASSLVEAARSQNVVCLKAAAGHVMRRYKASTCQLPRNVHSFRGGLAKAPISSYSAPVRSQARADQPNPVDTARVLSVSSEKTNSTAFVPSVELTKYAEVAVGSDSGSGMRDLVQKDQIHYQSDIHISAPVEQVPHEQSSESGESGYRASVSSGDPGNHTLDADAHVAMQISED
ncbi:uncharacterized protein [Henckelia pumila]|uniref:uncharacterized protein isoform X3 n=1 Tax=Henckelia pumila TaxID=405737 RepID=UPI003C6E01CC